MRFATSRQAVQSHRHGGHREAAARAGNCFEAVTENDDGGAGQRPPGRGVRHAPVNAADAHRLPCVSRFPCLNRSDTGEHQGSQDGCPQHGVGTSRIRWRHRYGARDPDVESNRRQAGCCGDWSLLPADRALAPDRAWRTSLARRCRRTATVARKRMTGKRRVTKPSEDGTNGAALARIGSRARVRAYPVLPEIALSAGSGLRLLTGTGLIYDTYVLYSPTMSQARAGQTRDRVFRFVRDRLLAGDPPTVREVQEVFGFRTPHTARYHLEKLVAERRLSAARGRARGYRLPTDAGVGRYARRARDAPRRRARHRGPRARRDLPGGPAAHGDALHH